jgi:DNA-binding NarL/FixJ family response regulator
MKQRIMIADDHKMVSEGLSELLATDYDLVGIVENGHELLEAAERYRPAIVIADISMPGLNGIEAMRQLRERDKDVKVVILTMHTDVSYAAEAISAGAAGYLLKISASDELMTALQEVSQGRQYVTPKIAAELASHRKNNSHIRNDALTKLSKRQCEVLQMLAKGNTAKEVAEALYVSPRTVEFHKYNVMKTLNLKTSAQLVHFAIKNGIITT